MQIEENYAQYDDDTNSFDQFSAMWAEEEGETISLNKHDPIPGNDDSEAGFDLTETDEFTEELLEYNKERAGKDLKDGIIRVDTLANNFHELPDDLVFNTSAGAITKSDIEGMAGRKTAMEAAYDGLSKFSQEMEMNEQYFRERSYAFELETDKRINSIVKEMNDPHTTDLRKGTLYSALLVEQQKKDIVNKEVEAYANQMNNARTEGIRQRFNHMEQVMSARHRDWSNERANVGQYLAESGIPEHDLANIISPQFAELVLKAYKYDKTIKDTQSSLDTVFKTPTNRAMPSNKQQSASRNEDARNGGGSHQQKEAIKRLNNGTFDSNDLGNLFDMLED